MTISNYALLLAQEEQTALIVNAINPDTYSPCEFCNRLTCKPYRTLDEHGADFCSEACMHRFIEDQEEDRDEEAYTHANSVMEKHEKVWNKFQDLMCGEASESVPHKDVLVEEIWITIEPSPEDMSGVETDEGWVKISYKNLDAYYVCDCICQKCNHKFEITALVLVSKKKKLCPICNKQEI